MRLINIQSGFKVNADKVESLEVIDQMTTRVVMESGMIYEAHFPIETFSYLLSIEEESPAEQQEQETNENILNRLNVLSKSSQFFAG